MTPRPVRAVIVSIVVALVSTTFITLSESATEYGEAFLMIVGGLPVAVGLCVITFRLAGASAPVGTSLVWVAVLTLPRLTADLDPPLAVWPVVLGTIAGGFVALTADVKESPTLLDAAGSWQRAPLWNCSNICSNPW